MANDWGGGARMTKVWETLGSPVWRYSAPLVSSGAILFRCSSREDFSETLGRTVPWVWVAVTVTGPSLDGLGCSLHRSYSDGAPPAHLLDFGQDPSCASLGFMSVRFMLTVSMSPPCVAPGINHDEWVPRWARNDSVNLTPNQDSPAQNLGNRTALQPKQQFKRAVETANHFIMSKETSNKNRAQGQHDNFAES